MECWQVRLRCIVHAPSLAFDRTANTTLEFTISEFPTNSSFQALDAYQKKFNSRLVVPTLAISGIHCQTASKPLQLRGFCRFWSACPLPSNDTEFPSEPPEMQQICSAAAASVEEWEIRRESSR
jgi:hypothetical protein